ncbi:MAG: glycosyltransferase family 2 protein [Acidobacteria bacterium]|nr:glycosyltransferase family 2 protein [Acidobacteriota bacterium]
MEHSQPRVSVVTPTFLRPAETLDLLGNLAKQTLLPFEVILVDGAPPEEISTEHAVRRVSNDFPFLIHYRRKGGGTAIQRNFGIDLASGDFIALIDDDVRLQENFLQTIIDVFRSGIGENVDYRL